MVYLQRFYLRHSVIHYPPEIIEYACLYLATKVHELNLTHDDFCRFFKQDKTHLNLVENE